ncbi:MAG: hypothetical protein WCH74_14100, partial [Chloroflexota bacterium]
MARTKVALATLAMALVFVWACPVMEAGELTPPAGPNDAASARFTLGDIWNRLSTGAAGAKRGATFVEPVAGPGTGTMKTTDEILAAAPAADNTSGATVGEVAAGRTFWGLRTDGTWGLKSGTLATRTPSAATTAQQAGIYVAFDLAVVDTDLVAGNIKTGTSIFGVAGTVIGATGDAAAANVLTGKTFSNATAAGIAGAMPIIAAATMTPTTAAQAIAAGYHSGAGTVAGDADLVAGNVRTGVNIFGVTGTVIGATGDAAAANVLTGKTFSNATAA